MPNIRSIVILNLRLFYIIIPYDINNKKLDRVIIINSSSALV